MAAAHRLDLDVAIEMAYAHFQLQVDLQLPAQGVVAICGPSGCGKSTLLHSIAGLHRPVRGRIRLGQTCWQDSLTGHWVPPHQRAIGMVFQDTRLFPHLTVQHNLAFGYQRTPPDCRQCHPEHIIHLLDLTPLLQRQPDTLSGGEQQRVAIARSLLISPQLLLLDEPLSALDETRKAEVLPYLARLKSELALPMLYVSHAVWEVATLADHLVVLDQGQVLAQGPMGELLSRPDLPMAQHAHAGVVITATVSAHDPTHRASCLHCPAGNLWIAALPHAPIGHTVRLQLAARDIALARQRPQASSLQNVFEARLISRHDDGLGHSHCQLQAQGVKLLACITQRAADALNLQPPETVFAHINQLTVLP